MESQSQNTEFGINPENFHHAFKSKYEQEMLQSQFADKPKQWKPEEETLNTATIQ